MRILVTGSSGLLGSRVAETLARRHEIVGLDLAPGPHTAHVGSVTQRELIFELMRSADAVVHTASLHAGHIHDHSPQQFVQTNMNGTINLLDASVEHRVRRFIYTSTTSVYGHAMEDPVNAVWVTEDIVPRPRDIYDITKLAAEQLCAVAARTNGMTCIALRVSRFFPEPLRLMAIYRLYRGVDVRDAAEAHGLALEAPISGFEIFNISAHSPFTRDQLHRLKTSAASLLRIQFSWLEEAFARRVWELPTSIDRVYVIEKAQRLLGYKPQFGLVQFLQQHGDAEARRLAGLLF